MATQITDEVARAVRAGDAGALARVWTAWAPAVTTYLRGGGVVDYEAVTGDVFAAIIPRLSGLSGGARGLRVLLFSIAHARVVDELRARARRPLLVSYDPALDRRVTSSAEDEAYATLAARAIADALQVLPPDQRVVVALRVVADLSVDQVARLMQRSAGAVKQLHRRGMIALRTALAEQRVNLAA